MVVLVLVGGAEGERGRRFAGATAAAPHKHPLGELRDRRWQLPELHRFLLCVCGVCRWVVVLRAEVEGVSETGESCLPLACRLAQCLICCVSLHLHTCPQLHDKVFAMLVEVHARLGGEGKGLVLSCLPHSNLPTPPSLAPP